MIELKAVSKYYDNKEYILKDISMKINSGDFIIIRGQSGSGKTSLLNSIGMIDDFDEGDILLDGRSYHEYKKRDKILLYRNKFGFLFQNFGLIENETVYDNLKIATAYKKNINEQEVIKAALFKVGLPNFEKRYIYTLSGGEQQRIAIARLFLKECQYIFADEPTGSLDPVNAKIIYQYLDELNQKGITIILVTHDQTFNKDNYINYTL